MPKTPKQLFVQLTTTWHFKTKLKRNTLHHKPCMVLVPSPTLPIINIHLCFFAFKNKIGISLYSVLCPKHNVPVSLYFWFSLCYFSYSQWLGPSCSRAFQPLFPVLYFPLSCCIAWNMLFCSSSPGLENHENTFHDQGSSLSHHDCFLSVSLKSRQLKTKLVAAGTHWYFTWLDAGSYQAGTPNVDL